MTSTDHRFLASAALESGWKQRTGDLAAWAWDAAVGQFDFDRFADRGPDAWEVELAKAGLGELSVHVPGQTAEFSMASTLLVTKLAVRLVLETEAHPLELAYAVARLAENSLHTFVDPDSGRRHRNLTAAKRFGTFFTPPDVALHIAEQALLGRPIVRTLVEPAAGTGMLSAAAAVQASHLGTRVLSMTAIEVNGYLAEIGRMVLDTVVKRVGLGAELTVRTGDALVALTSGEKFDAIVLNPPYGRVKFEKSSTTNVETRAADAQLAEELARAWVGQSRSRYLSLAKRLEIGGGTLDFQRLFLAAALEAISEDGRLVVISPTSWISGRDSEALRSRIISKRLLASLDLYREDAHLFPTVNQPTAIAVFEASDQRRNIRISEMGSKSHQPERAYDVSYSDVRVQDGARIPVLPPALMTVLRALSAKPRLRDMSEVKNARGEFDLTLDGHLIEGKAPSAKNARLIRGDHIERYSLRSEGESKKVGRVSPEVLVEILGRPKGGDLKQPRIVVPQVSYMGKRRRLNFALVPAGVVVANSCNYLLTPDEPSRFALLGLLNSSVVEWWFRTHSSNNHVSNYEIGGIPWALGEEKVASAIARLARQIVELRAADASGASSARAEEILDALVFYAYGVAPSAVPAVLAELGEGGGEQIASMVAWFNYYGVPPVLSDQDLLQHEIPTLSALDIEMLEHVPQGGNWQQIPVSVPSARLAQIRAMTAERGVVRTTYYGRLRPDQPAYTIATYYNRPGNGTNIHPYENRTLTHREAARLQSFPDAYVFMGSEGAIRKQIGNAVPPLLGYAIGAALSEAGLRGPVVDLFAGAGGLSAGLEMRGHEVAVAVDNDASCEATYTFNRSTERLPDPASNATLFRRSDLSSETDREAALAAIRQKIGTRALGALVGGPPCQGFSHAGFRDHGDLRNDLAVVFMDFVRELSPEFVVLENVEGLLSYRKGQVARELVETLVELGYFVGQPWVLAAEQYGVPQMRRRVFIVGSRTGLVSPPAAHFQRCLGRREREPRDIDHENLRYPITVADALAGIPPLSTRTHGNTGQREVIDAYKDFCAGRVPADQFLERARR